MRAANDLARLHICAISPEPSLIALQRRDVSEGSGHFYTSSCDLGTYPICEQRKTRRASTVSPEPSLIALERRDIDELFIPVM